jgi:phosphoglycerol transferase MdoB-like AlkP superfamily enzyme
MSYIYLESIGWFSLTLFVLLLIIRCIILITFGKKSALGERKKDILKAFWLGGRFDLKVIAIANALPLLLAIPLYIIDSPSLFNFSAYILVAYYFISLSSIVLLLSIDVAFFTYFNEHINYMIFGFFDDDTKAVIETMRDYNLPLVIGVILALEVGLFFLAKFIGFYHLSSLHYHGWLVSILLIVFIVIDFLLARGTISSLPLGIMHARVSDNEFINKLCMNGIFSFTKAVKLRRQNKKGSYNLSKTYGFHNDPAEALLVMRSKKVTEPVKLTEHLSAYVVPNETATNQPPHVVLIMMESFASHILSFEEDNLDLMASLRKHFEQDIVFKNFTSDGQGTIESFLALTSNLPHRANCSNYPESRLINAEIKSSAAFVYKEKGYETSVVYGGSLTWRNIGTFLKFQGFDHVEGDSHIRKAIPKRTNTYEHSWGLHDEYLFDYLKQKLKQAKKPQFIVALNTSNHPPYNYPETYDLGPSEITSDIEQRLMCSRKLMKQRLEVYQYANSVAGDFMDWLKDSELAEHTIVSMTGDHSFWGMYSYTDSELFQRYCVPCYFYVPKNYLPETIDTSIFGSHKDILPTLYHMSLSDVNYLTIGTNLFNLEASHYAFNSSELIAGPSGVVTLVPQPQYYQWTDDYLVKPSDKTQELQSILEYYKAAMSITDMFIRDCH